METQLIIAGICIEFAGLIFIFQKSWSMRCAGLLLVVAGCSLAGQNAILPTVIFTTIGISVLILKATDGKRKNHEPE